MLVVLGLLFAMMLNRKIRGMGFFRTMYYMPNILSVAVVGVIFSRIFAPDHLGVLNVLLVQLGFDPIPRANASNFAYGKVKRENSPQKEGRCLTAKIKEMQKEPVALIEQFSDLPDPRVERTKKHKLIDIIFITICAAICGAEGWTDVEEFGLTKQDWLRQFVELKLRSPNKSSIKELITYWRSKIIRNT